MASGPEHYREAERLMSLEPLQRTGSGELDAPAALALMAEAQVHATLALAAATALAGVTIQLPVNSDFATEWNQAIGVPGSTP